MAQTTLDVRNTLAHKTEAQWSSQNPVALNGELMISTDKNMMKIGDGSKKWSELPYATADVSNQFLDVVTNEIFEAYMNELIDVWKTSGYVDSDDSFDSSGVVELNYDASLGYYTNIEEYLKSKRDAKVFTVKIPLYSSTSTITCTKADDNVNLTCTPSTNSTAGQDMYRDILAFFSEDCNGYIDSEGMPYVTAIEGDSRFKRDGSNGDVWCLCPVLYWRLTQDSTHKILSISDSRHSGFKLQPHGRMINDRIRPFMLYAKYPLVMYNGVASSVSGQPVRIRDVSHNSIINIVKAKGTGYSGKTSADDWYVKVMMLIKYGSKSSEHIMSGCISYNCTYYPTVAEKGVKRIILSNANANNIMVGSSFMFGKHTSSSTDRYYSYNYDIFDGAVVTSIETYDSNNKAVYFNKLNKTFDTETTYLLNSRPWNSGACDNVKGKDGSPINNRSNKEPFIIQGIEIMHGAYEILSDVILNAFDDNGTLKEEIYMCYDSKNFATSITANYVDTGFSLPIAAADGWSYSKDIENANGLLFGSGYGASSTTGTGDATYQNVKSSKGIREWQSLGHLGGGSPCGLFCVPGDDGLGVVRWNIAARISGNGRAAA